MKQNIFEYDLSNRYAKSLLPFGLSFIELWCLFAFVYGSDEERKKAETAVIPFTANCWIGSRTKNIIEFT